MESSERATSAIAATLLDGELELIGQIRTASNATLVCDAVLNDQRIRCVYKPVRGEQPLWDFPDGTLAGREVASYLISDALGWSVVPTTVLRPDGPFGAGMVQRWIDTVDSAADLTHIDLVDIVPTGTAPDGFLPILDAYGADGEEITLVHADDPRLQRMAVLDVVINNADRKGGHVLDGVDGQIYGVDHGICLHAETKLRTVLWGWAGTPTPAHLVADLATLHSTLERSGDLRSMLESLITSDEVTALTLRVEELVDTSVMPAPTTDRPIPWPAF